MTIVDCCVVVSNYDDRHFFLLNMPFSCWKHTSFSGLKLGDFFLIWNMYPTGTSVLFCALPYESLKDLAWMGDMAQTKKKSAKFWFINALNLVCITRYCRGLYSRKNKYISFYLDIPLSLSPISLSYDRLPPSWFPSYNTAHLHLPIHLHLPTNLHLPRHLHFPPYEINLNRKYAQKQFCACSLFQQESPNVRPILTGKGLFF